MKNNKHSFEFKVKVVTDYLNNEGGYNYLSKKYNVDSALIRTWLTQYNQFGYEGLTNSMTHTHYSGEFKRAVLQYRQENQLSYREAAIHFGIRNSSTIANWQRKLHGSKPTVLEGEIGRLRKHMSKDDKEIDSNKPLNETEREEFERLKEQFRMSELENIILKKSNALPYRRRRT